MRRGALFWFAGHGFFPQKCKFGLELALMTLQQLFDAFNTLNVLIIGDVMVDAYSWVR
jgi:hypothetical protein